MPRPLQGPGIAASLSTVTLFILYLITSYAKDNLCLGVGKQWREEKKQESEDTLRDIALMIIANVFACPLRS